MITEQDFQNKADTFPLGSGGWEQTMLAYSDWLQERDDPRGLAWAVFVKASCKPYFFDGLVYGGELDPLDDKWGWYNVDLYGSYHFPWKEFRGLSGSPAGATGHILLMRSMIPSKWFVKLSAYNEVIEGSTVPEYLRQYDTHQAAVDALITAFTELSEEDRMEIFNLVEGNT